MIASFLSPIFNHLWQSTLVAAAAGVLSCVLRRNRAHTRYWLWLIASVKFLIPFSLLVAVGSRVDWSTGPAIASAGFSMVMEEFGHPFANAPTRFLTAASMPLSHGDFLAALLVMVWIVGFAVILARWYVSWKRVGRAMRAGSPLGLEVNVPVLSTPALLEPGVFGIWRPVLLLPEGIAEHLAPAQLSAVIAHELCHVRRRDNLAAAVHMVVEAIFWFHPLVWWLGARLVEERERACDEEVLRMGNEPNIYAESILKTCQFYVESPLVCVSGVTGSGLKQRIIHIMNSHAMAGLSLQKKVLLAIAGVATVAFPLAIGAMDALPRRAQSEPANGAVNRSFEIASIKPSKPNTQGMMVGGEPGGRFVANGITVKLLIQNAYDLRDFQISGGPSWISSERYDIVAKSSGENSKNVQPELRSLLAERFQFRCHTTAKQAPIYELVRDGATSKLQTAKSPTDADGVSMSMRPGQLTAYGISMANFAANLSNIVHRNVLDKTGTTGLYQFTLRWSPDQISGAGPDGRDSWIHTDSDAPSIFTALREQLGLKLEPAKGPVSVMVIDHVEKASEN
ncbi:MAG TPA: M56 family metallopeptidase [Bryobacteraceae bacterium]|jgi:uncharacterized protein (TIGR03435 family)|nr:M56 family metallopeptidase [Bryobacteraceae bacterium]